ncbi:MAG TPA: aspartate-semialdehyde dehydrogenase [Planctomycetota bacterium]|nr:aspartate-semialdehyde dehydrogenase [Planctomycetota bacterium]
MAKQYSVAVVGIGAVGTEMLKVLDQRQFPAKSIRVFARSARAEEIAGKTYQVEETTPEAFNGVDIAIFAGTEGAKGASQLFGWQAVAKGAVVIDNGDDFRMDPRVALVVPECNAEALRRHQGFVANPNCSTIQMVVALAPLHRVARIRRIVVSSYQAVSGTGRSAIDELQAQISAIEKGQEPRVEVYPHRIALNLFPHIGRPAEEMPGYYSEEVKMRRETRKILGDPEIQVSATCVRVPVFNAHSEAVNVQFEKKMTAAQAREILQGAPGVVVIDDPAKAAYPMPLMASGTDPVYVGRIRDDVGAPNCIDLWCVSDNIRKGAALNAVQIAEKMIEMGLI